jgi:hypothetical protein
MLPAVLSSPPRRDPESMTNRPTWNDFEASGAKEIAITAVALAAVGLHLTHGFAGAATALGRPAATLPLYVALACGTPLLLALAVKLARLEFGSDLLAGVSVVTSVALGEYLAGTLVVLMHSGGQALEAFAIRLASAVSRRALTQTGPGPG